MPSDSDSDLAVLSQNLKPGVGPTRIGRFSDAGGLMDNRIFFQIDRPGCGRCYAHSKGVRVSSMVRQHLV